MAQLKRPMSAIFKHLSYENYYLKIQNADLARNINTLQSNIAELNKFIMTQYDLSLNVLENLRIVTFNKDGVILSCIHADSSGNFVACDETSSGYLPCVLTPYSANQQGIEKTQSNQRDSDGARCFPEYGYPYYPNYRYGYGYGYPYYPYLMDDDYFYRDMDLSGVKMHVHMRAHTTSLQGLNGTHIHIHNK
uniref:Uncharacterized protein n=1 Tax=viral metagenome TaxID=1070528 RepID=A0A6C0L8R3_9ZZZZ